MKKYLLFLAGLLIFAGLSLAIYDYLERKEAATKAKNSSQLIDNDKNNQSDEATVKYPVTDEFLLIPKSGQQQEEDINTDVPVISPGTVHAPDPKPVPELDESDETLEEALIELVGKQRFNNLFLIKSIVRHFVVTIDNMTEKKLPQKFKFTQSPPDRFTISKETEDIFFIDQKNYSRYTPFVELLEEIDSHFIVSVYVRYYALFQQAYEELGYPGRYFNDRLVEVIDHLLASPEIQGRIKLVRPKVFYNFANPDLEALSAGQKIMVRTGFDNAVRIKAKLRKLRELLTAKKIN